MQCEREQISSATSSVSAEQIDWSVLDQRADQTNEWLERHGRTLVATPVEHGRVVRRPQLARESPQQGRLADAGFPGDATDRIPNSRVCSKSTPTSEQSST